jgi:hypothetical protein
LIGGFRKGTLAFGGVRKGTLAFCIFCMSASVGEGGRGICGASVRAKMLGGIVGIKAVLGARAEFWGWANSILTLFGRGDGAKPSARAKSSARAEPSAGGRRSGGDFRTTARVLGEGALGIALLLGIKAKVKFSGGALVIALLLGIKAKVKSSGGAIVVGIKAKLSGGATAAKTKLSAAPGVLVPFLTSLLIGGSGLSSRIMASLGLEGGVGSLSGGSGRLGSSA